MHSQWGVGVGASRKKPKARFQGGGGIVDSRGVASVLGPMRRIPPTPTGAFGSWLLPSWWRLSTAQRGLTGSSWEAGVVSGSLVWVGGFPAASSLWGSLSQGSEVRGFSLWKRNHTRSGLCLCVVLTWGLTLRCPCSLQNKWSLTKNASAQNSLDPGHYMTLPKWRGLARSCPHVCREREEDKRWLNTWHLSNSTLPGRCSTKSSS